MGPSPVCSVYIDVFRCRFYGCGLLAPECLEGSRILDLGSGSGQDCYVMGKLVGEAGEVVGIDMTQEQVRDQRGQGVIHMPSGIIIAVSNT